MLNIKKNYNNFRISFYKYLKYDLILLVLSFLSIRQSCVNEL